MFGVKDIKYNSPNTEKIFIDDKFIPNDIKETLSSKTDNEFMFIRKKYHKYLSSLISSKIESMEKEVAICEDSHNGNLSFLRGLLIDINNDKEPDSIKANIHNIDNIDLVSNGILITSFKVKK